MTPGPANRLVKLRSNMNTRRKAVQLTYGKLIQWRKVSNYKGMNVTVKSRDKVITMNKHIRSVEKLEIDKSINKTIMKLMFADDVIINK